MAESEPCGGGGASDPLIDKLLRAADQRLSAAEFLLERADLTLDATYLAGYAVEIGLKALLLHCTAAGERQGVYASFRGAGWHRFEKLKEELKKRNCDLPLEILGDLRNVSVWGTERRYEAGHIKYEEAEEFCRAVRRIRDWVRSVIHEYNS